MPNKWLTPDAPASGFICRTLRIPDSEDFLSIVNGALLQLGYASQFEPFGALTPDETAEYFQQMFEDYGQSEACMIGAIIAYATANPPANSLACDGASYDRVDYPALYAALDDAFLLDADTFIVPDLRGRTVIGTGTGSGLSARSMGDSAGAERITLSTDEIPSHSHGESIAVPTLINGGLEAPASSATPGSGTTGSAGGGASHDNMMPYFALRYAIIAR